MNLDFLEIGTSDFDTEIQTCSDSATGMAVDPVAFYLQRLPNKAGVIKVCAAISDCDGVATVYNTPETVISKYGLPDWVRGCNSIDTPHPTVSRLFAERNISADEGWHIAEIEKLSFRTLIRKYDIQNIGYLKIDTEGHDCVIMRNVHSELTSPDSPLLSKPRKILFEANVLSSREHQEEIIQLFESTLGYKAQRLSQDIVLTCE